MPQTNDLFLILFRQDPSRLNTCNHGRRKVDLILKHWLQNDLLLELFSVFKNALFLSGTNDQPMSAAYPIVCALKNEV